MPFTVAELNATLSLDSSGFSKGLGVASVALGSFLGSMGPVGIGIAAIATSAIALGEGISNAGRRLQDAWTPVGTILGTTSDEFGQLTKGLEDILKNSPVSPEDLGMASYQALSAGFTDVTTNLDIMNQAVMLGAAGLGTTKQATDLITASMINFSDENLTATQAAQELFGTVKLNKTTISQLSQGFGNVAPLADQLGISFNELMSATGALTNQNRPASQSYAGLAQIMKGILKPTKDQSKAAHQLGMDFTYAHFKAVGFTKFMEEARDAVGRAGGDESLLARMFGGRTAMSTALGLLSDKGWEDFQKNLGGITDMGGKLVERYEQVKNTFTNQLAILRNRALVYLGDIGKQINEWLGPILARFVDWIANNWPRITGTIRDVALGVGDLLKVVFGPAFEAIKPYVQSFIDWLRENWPEIKRIIGPIADWLKDVAAPAIGAALATLIEQFARLIGWVKDHWPEIQAVIERFVNWLRDEAWPAIAGFGQNVIDLWNRLHDWTAEKWPAIRAWIENAWNWIRDNVFPIFSYVWEVIKGVWEQVHDWTVSHWDQIKTFLSDVWTTIGGIATLAWAALKLAWKQLGDDLIKIIKDTWDFIGNIFQAAFDVIRGLFHIFASLFRGDWSGVWEGVKEVAKGIWEGITAVFKFVIVDGLTSAWGILTSILDPAWRLFWNTMKQFFSDIWDAIKRHAQESITTLKGLIIDPLNWFKDNVWAPFWDGFTSLVSGKWQALHDALDPIIGAIRGSIDWLKEGVQFLIDKIQEVVDKVKGPFSAVSGVIQGVIGGAGGFAHSVGLAAGGIAIGSTSGYPVTLHGTEAVLPLNDKARTQQILNAIGMGGGGDGGANVTVIIVQSEQSALNMVPSSAQSATADAFEYGRRYAS